MRAVLRWLEHRELFRRAVRGAVLRDPSLAVEPLGGTATLQARFDTVGRWPEAVDGFEDLAFLFTSGQLNMGVALLTFDEAALLYRTARSLPPGSTAVEVGRFKGGSTFLLAAAMPHDAELWSYDLHVKLREEMTGERLDAQLSDALERYDLLDRVRLLVGDSRTAPAPPEPWDLIFLDGDHSYDGVRADYERWRTRLQPGGHLLFHDAAGATPHAGVVRLVAEIADADRQWLEPRGTAGSVAHFVRTRAPAPWDEPAALPV
jgi:predicted O-methyltransferase YrrM